MARHHEGTSCQPPRAVPQHAIHSGVGKVCDRLAVLPRMPRTLSRRYGAPANWFWLEIPGLARCRKGSGQKHGRNHRLRFNMRPLEAYQPEDLKVASDRRSRPYSVFSALRPPFVGSGYIVVDCLDGPAPRIRFVPEPGLAGVLRKVLPPYALCAGSSRVCPVVLSQLESARAEWDDQICFPFSIHFPSSI